MKIVDFETIKKMDISPSLCFEWVSEMIKKKKDAFLPAKTHMNLPGNVFCNVMPSIIDFHGTKMGGIKAVTRYPKREPSLDSKILLFNADSGEFLSLMDGNWITAMRTGAVAAHSIITLAKSKYKTIGMIGLGNTARATLLILNEVESERKLTIKLLRYKDQAELFSNRFKDFNNLTFEVYDTAQEVVKGSDVVISCATYFDNDICSDDAFDEGVLVVPVHTRGFTNCDLFFDKVFADDTGHVDHFKNFSKFKYYAEVSDVVNNISAGREDNKERILAYNIGVSMHDINYAAQIYNLLEQDKTIFNNLLEADLHDPTEKYWV